MLYLLIPAASLIWLGLWLLTRKPQRGEDVIYTEPGRGHLSRKALYKRAGIK